MKKITKFLVVALTVALLIGAVVGVISSAAETEGEKWVVSKNVSYDENTHLFFAIDASLAEDSSLLKVDVLDAAGTSLVGEELLTVSEESVDIYEDDSMIAHVVKTPGVAAKDMADVFTINVYYGETADETTLVDTTTYSVAEYFLERLYKDGVVDAAELAEGTDEEIAAAKKAVSQKKLYEASLRYGAAAQKVLAASDTTLIENLIYVTSPFVNGVVSKGYAVELGETNYKFDYYSDTNKGVDYDITGASGYYVLDESMVITNATPHVSAPAGAATFEDLTVTDTDIDTANSYDAISGAVEDATGLVSVGAWSQSQALQNVTVGEDGANKYIRHEVTSQTSSFSHTLEVIRDTATEGDVLVLQVRMRMTRTSGNNQIRIYKGRTAGNGTRHQFETMTSGFGGTDWFTLRIVFTNNASGGVDYKYYKAADAASIDMDNPTLSGSLAMNSGTVSSITELNNFTIMSNTSHVGHFDWDYVYFTTVADMDAVNALVESGETLTVSLAPSYYSYESTSIKDHVITSGASFTNNNSTYTSNFGYVKAEGENKYVSFTDTTTTGQAQLMFTNTNDLTDKDTLTFNVDLRFSDNPNGTNAYHSGDNSVQIRVRNASSSSSANTGYLRIYADDNGKVKVSDYSGGVVATDIDASEWFTVSVSYTSNAAKCQVTITSGEKSANAEIAATSEAHQVAISAITNIGIYTSTGFMGIFDVDNVSIVAE